jgi:hypothetical protein
VSPNFWVGVGAVFPNVEVRHLHAVIALGEELHFTKAALRLNLTQSALSRQITEIEKQLRFRLFTKPAALGCCAQGVVVKPLSDESLCFQTCVIMRKDDDSRLTNEFARSFLRRYAYQRRPPKPIELSPTSRVVSIKKASSPARR